MKKSLLTAVLAAAFAMPVASALPIPATPGGNAITFSKAQQKGVRLTPAQIKTIEAVTGPQNRQDKKMELGGNRLSRLSPRYSLRHQSTARRANASGSIFEGWRVDYIEEKTGWYRLSDDGTQELLWRYNGGVDDLGQEISFPFNMGFLRNGKVYAIGSNIFFYWALMEYGVFTRSGEIEQYIPCEDFSEDMSHYTMSVAYDNRNDVAYGYTLNSDGTAYMFQAIDPDTWEYSPLNTDVPLADVCGGIAYNPIDGNIYGLTTDSRFVRISTEDGSLETVHQYDFEPSSSVKPMVYSPYDNAFVFVRPDTWGTAQLCEINATDYAYSEMADIDDTTQYPILICPDKVVENGAPAVPKIESITFQGGDLTGVATVTMPNLTFDGQPLTGAVTLVTYTDGVETGRAQGQAGATVTVDAIAKQPGRHTFRFAAETDGMEGPGIEQSMYVGFDTPMAPENVELTEKMVTWEPVTQGVNNGYIDVDALTYNVYIDGRKQNKQPIAETQFAVTMPDGYYAAHVATVEAVNHELVSSQAYSNNVCAGTPLPMPMNLLPTEKQAQLFTIISGGTNPYGRWLYGNNEYFSISTYAYTPDYETEEWLILPPVKVGDIDNMVEIDWEVCCTYPENPENLTVAIGPTADPADMKVIEKFEGMTNEEFVDKSTWVALQPGTYYVGFMTKKSKEGNQLAVKTFCVDESNISSSSPARPANLTAAALPQGGKGAIVEFDMPTLDVAGNALAADTQLEAKLSCGNYKATATGKPGSHQSAQITTKDGFNDIEVCVGGGLPATVRVFTGLDIPAPISVMNVTTSADNLGLTLDWEAPTTGEHGGYVDPAEITYNLVFPGENGWEIADDLGKERTVSLSVNKGPQGLAQVGVLASNASGHSDTFRSTTQILGDPYVLPVVETFEEYDFPVGPSFMEQPTEEYSGATSFYNTYYDDIPDGKNSLVFDPLSNVDHSYCRVVLPKVTLKGTANPTIEARLYFGPDAGTFRVVAQTYDNQEAVVGEIDCNAEEKHIEGVRFVIPDKYKGYDWTCFKLEAEFQNPNQRVLLESLSILDLLDKDMEMTQLEAPMFMLTSQKVNITAQVRNSGIEPLAAPKMNCEITVNGHVIANVVMTATDAPANLEPMQTLAYQCEWTPDVEAGNGALTVTATIDTNDDNEANNSLAVQGTVCRGNQAIINDLTAESMGDDVNLTWTEPKANDGVESFENFASFSYYNPMGDFTSLDQDGYDLVYFSNIDVPGMGKPKAWQVFSENDINELYEPTGIENSWCAAHSGDKMIAAMVPYSVYIGEGLRADDWMISPELVEGSDFSFWAMSMMGETEDIEVLTGTDPEDIWSFETVKHVYPFGLKTWLQYSFTLPEGHKYFAIRYVGNSDNNTGVFVDDIEYHSAAPASDPVIGYDVLRDGASIVENQPCAGSYADIAALQQVASPTYNVVPVMQGAAGVYRGQRSNTARLTATSINEINSSNSNTYYDLMGRRTDARGHGIYIMVNGGKAQKVRK